MYKEANILKRIDLIDRKKPPNATYKPWRGVEKKIRIFDSKDMLI